MQRTVVVPLDGSPFAEQALPEALCVARRAKAPLLLVRVQPPLPLGVSDAEARSYLEAVAAQIDSQTPAGVAVQVLVDQYGPQEFSPPPAGAVADVLCRRLRESDTLLTVMATHGHGGVARAWLGSVADSLIRRTPRPVLLVRPSDERYGLAVAADRGIHHIMVPLDGSSSARRVLPLAVEFGRLFDARYTLVRVVSPLAWEVSPYSRDPYPAYSSPLSGDAAQAYLDDVAAGLRDDGLEVATCVVHGQSPADAILALARDSGGDVIAIGTEGAGRIRRLLLGSVTDRVVRHCDLPVLVCNVRSVSDDAASDLSAGAAAL